MTRASSYADADAQFTSNVYLDEWVPPEIADEHGLLRAGKILEWMDVVGVLCATRFCRLPVVTASVDGIQMVRGVRVGERVSMTAQVAYTSSRTIGIAIEMSAGHAGLEPEEVMVGYMTFVPVDDDGVPQSAPSFAPGNPAEQRRYREGRLRQEFRQRIAALPAVAAETTATDTLASAHIIPVGDRQPVRPPHDSYVHKIEPVRGGTLNFHGTLYGGTLMRWIETAGLLSARAHLDGAYVRFCALHGLNFLRPVRRHVFIHVRSVVAHTSRDSITVLVKVQAEDPLAAEGYDTLRAFLTYRPLDSGIEIPGLDCQSAEDWQLYREVEARRQLEETLVR